MVWIKGTKVLTQERLDAIPVRKHVRDIPLDLQAWKVPCAEGSPSESPWLIGEHTPAGGVFWYQTKVASPGSFTPGHDALNNPTECRLLHFKGEADRNARIEGALARLRSGDAGMRVPPDPTDPDLVLVACRNQISFLEGQLREANQRKDVVRYMACPAEGNIKVLSDKPEIDRLKALINDAIGTLTLDDCMEMTGRLDQLTFLVDHVRREREKAEKERDKLRQALIDIANRIRGAASTETSTEFLLQVPGEVDAVMRRFERTIADAAQVLEACKP